MKTTDAPMTWPEYRKIELFFYWAFVGLIMLFLGGLVVEYVTPPFGEKNYLGGLIYASAVLIGIGVGGLLLLYDLYLVGEALSTKSFPKKLKRGGVYVTNGLFVATLAVYGVVTFAT